LCTFFTRVADALVVYEAFSEVKIEAGGGVVAYLKLL
jgi:hypothetical protein